MKILRSAIGSAVVSMVVIAGTLTLFTATAQAREVATRCSAYGCARIVCNNTGDRCRRFDEDIDRRWDSYDEPRRDSVWHHARYSERYRNWHYDCDHDADACYVRRSGYSH